MPACTECRRRKLRCSKELPACRECRRLGAECVYEARENKPGMKPGAVENLNRRVDHLENLLRRLDEKTDPVVKSFNQSNLGIGWSSSNDSPVTGSSTQHHNRTTQLSGSFSPTVDSPTTDHVSPRKRRKLECKDPFSWSRHILSHDLDAAACNIGLNQLLKLIVDTYFLNIHPWIPMIHEATFRDSISHEVYTAELESILRAIVVAGFKFLKSEVYGNHLHLQHLIEKSRKMVILNATSALSVGNLQALIIIAFDDIGSGNASKAWPIVGSLTRTVDYLQLSIENEVEDEQPLLKPCPLLPISQRWTETEERRRVFWNVFNLDRLCSVVTGWNTSLTSDDVHRCLPVDGILWRKGESVITPYFGIWDKSAGKIGNSIAFLPTHHSSPSQTMDGTLRSPGPNLAHQPEDQTLETSTIGAFAYCIEATESMSRVTTYFLQQKVNFRDQEQVGSWLTRFKELDLRLVQWKKFLPHKWKDTNLSRKPSEIIMDPNLTLAHITHNTSIILLHQVIAYPDKSWTWAKRLPSRRSADTCQSAAIETASICQKFLASPTRSSIVHSQFVFCAFLSARVLLVQWKYYPVVDINPMFADLLLTLDTLSSRWNGQPGSGVHSANLASKYAARLRNTRSQCINDPKFSIDVLGYVNDLQYYTSLDGSANDNSDRSRSLVPIHINSPESSEEEENSSENEVEDRNSIPQPWGMRTGTGFNLDQEISAAESLTDMHTQSSQSLGGTNQGFVHPIPAQSQFNVSNDIRFPYFAEAPPLFRNASVTSNTAGRRDSLLTGTGEYDDFNSLSQIFSDQQYMEMDRIISFDDGMFSADMDLWNGGQEPYS